MMRSDQEDRAGWDEVVVRMVLASGFVSPGEMLHMRSVCKTVCNALHQNASWWPAPRWGADPVEDGTVSPIPGVAPACARLLAEMGRQWYSPNARRLYLLAVPRGEDCGNALYREPMSRLTNMRVYEADPRNYRFHVVESGACTQLRPRQVIVGRNVIANSYYDVCMCDCVNWHYMRYMQTPRECPHAHFLEEFDTVDGAIIGHPRLAVMYYATSQKRDGTAAGHPLATAATNMAAAAEDRQTAWGRTGTVPAEIERTRISVGAARAALASRRTRSGYPLTNHEAVDLELMLDVTAAPDRGWLPLAEAGWARSIRARAYLRSHEDSRYPRVSTRRRSDLIMGIRRTIGARQ